MGSCMTTHFSDRLLVVSVMELFCFCLCSDLVEVGGAQLENGDVTRFSAPIKLLQYQKIWCLKMGCLMVAIKSDQITPAQS